MRSYQKFQLYFKESAKYVGVTDYEYFETQVKPEENTTYKKLGTQLKKPKLPKQTEDVYAFTLTPKKVSIFFYTFVFSFSYFL